MPAPPERPHRLTKLTIGCFMRAQGDFSEQSLKKADQALVKAGGQFVLQLANDDYARSPDAQRTIAEMSQAMAMKYMRGVLTAMKFEVEGRLEIAVGDAFRIAEPLVDLKIIDGKLADIARQKPRPLVVTKRGTA